MRTDMPFAGSFHFLAKGDFKTLLLRILKDHPMHGYEVIKSLEERYHGFYKPSPGTVYPALRALLRQGLVNVSGEERRKTYRISRKGRQYLKSRRAEIERRFRRFESTVGPERVALLREIMTTGRTLGPNMRNATPEQAVELRKVLIEMRERMMRIFAK